MVRPDYPELSKKQYEKSLYNAQAELVKLQRQLIADEERVLVILEGRDAAGKDGTIKRLTEHMAPRETRVVALPKPTDRDRTSWYFQRYVAQLPAGGEFVIFNRSWYNRAGVEPVMGFCTGDEHEQFMRTVTTFETMLVRSGVQIFKYYLDIDKKEQKERLTARTTNPLKQWKVSSLDKEAQKRWDAYSDARNSMLARTHHVDAPWRVVRADHKRTARVHVLRDLLSSFTYKDKSEELIIPDRRVVAQFTDELLHSKFLAP